MSLDPVRADRVRRMVPNPASWPGPLLHMKRIEGDRIVEFGSIFKSRMTPGRVPLQVGKTEIVFADAEALIDAGWAVD